MKKMIFLLISVMVGILVYQENGKIIIPNDSIRVRIVANSNSIEDLYSKKKLKDEIKDELFNLVKDASNKEEASNVIEANITKINNMVASKTNDFQIQYGMNFFPKKIYKGVLYQEGEYSSLVITLGKGLGDNWWCVLYPPLCMIEDNHETDDVDFQLYVSHLLKIDSN